MGSIQKEIPVGSERGTLPRLKIFEAIAKHDPKSTAIVHSASGRQFTYGELMDDVAEAKERLVREVGGGGRGEGLRGERIAFLVENSYDYVGAQLYILSVSYFYRQLREYLSENRS